MAALSAADSAFCVSSMSLTLPIVDMSGLEWTPDVSMYRQRWRENTGACLQVPAGEGMTMTDTEGLEYRTWPQLKACALTAIPVLRKLADDGSGDALDALEKIDHILSDDWEGPAK